MTYLTSNNFRLSYTLPRLLLLLWVMVLYFLFLTAAYGDSTNTRLWKIDKNGIESSYILATMHSEDPRILYLPHNYNIIFKNAKSFTAEIDMSLDNSAALAKIMMLPKNKKLRKLIGNDLFEKSVTILKGFGIPEKFVNRMKPWAVLMTLSYPKSKTGLFLDKLLFEQAIKMKKKSYGLETVQEQIAIFNNISYLHQTILLRDSIKQYPNFGKQLEKLKLLYIKGDLDGLVHFNKEIMLQGNYRVAQKLMKKLIDNRNEIMVKRMQVRLREGGAFIAVGALHLPGEVGILQLLRNQQYKLTPINLN